MSCAGRLTRDRCFVAAVLLTSFGWLTSSTAQASCNHVTVKTDESACCAIGLDQLDALGALADELRPSEIPQWPDLPCAGPQCYRNRRLPPPMPRAVSRIDVWGCLDLSAFTMQQPSTSFPFDDRCPPPSLWAERLVRPPR